MIGMTRVPVNGRRFLPIDPPLAPSLFLGERCQSAFPFNAERRYWYLLGRYALWQGLRLLDLKEGDEVLVPSYNSGVEVGAIADLGLVPRFFTVNRDLTFDVDDLESRISQRTRALLVIHYIGLPQPLPKLKSLCGRYGLRLIEDCAQALFSSRGEIDLGSEGAFSIFSVYKTLPLPHGGLLVVNDPELASPPEPRRPPLRLSLKTLRKHIMDGLEMRRPALRMLRRTGVARNLSSRERADFGIADEEFHRSFSSFAASPLARRLASRCNAQEIFTVRRRNFEILSLLLPSSMRLLHSLPEGVCPLFFPALVQDKRAAARTLAERGIETFPFWSLAHPAAQREGFSDADFLRAHVLALPIHQALTTSDIEYLADSVIALGKNVGAPDEARPASWPGASEVPVKT